MKSIKKIVSASLLISLIMLFSVNLSAGENKVFDLKSVSAGGKIPDFVWLDNGKEVSFKEFTKGKIVFLNMWATWCPPCRRELPDIEKISKELKNKDVIVIGISSDTDKKYKSKVNAMVKSKGLTYINILDNEKKITGSIKGGIQYFPTTFIIDKNGKISDKLIGGKSYSEFMKALNRVL